MRMIGLAGIAVAVLAAGTPASAAPLLHAMFQNHAVLQRDKPVPVWGSTRPGVTVTVTLDGKRVSAKADAKGHWRVTFAPHAAGGPYRLEARSSDGRSAVVEDVMLGDVWLCSGQSNMEFALRQVTNADAELAGAADAGLRLFHVPRQSSPMPLAEFDGAPAWRLSSPESARDFSAACYFMGRDLRRDQKVPVGLIAASWGGSNAEDWISGEVLRKLGGFDAGLDLLARYRTDPQGAEAAYSNWIAQWMAEHAGSTAWAAPELAEGDWKPVPSLSLWEGWSDPALARFDGTVWYRTTVELTPEQARGRATLTLGEVDDADTSFINGEAVGSDLGWNRNRRYAVRAGLLRPGRNVIAVRVLDMGGGGGVKAPEPKLELPDGSAVPLASAWRYRIGGAPGETGAPPARPWQAASGLSTLFNGMVAPVAPYAVKGFAWYQGESNIGDPEGYQKLLPALIADWRTRFSADPFLVVQLANFGPASEAPGDSGWARLREVQRRVAAADPKVALATAIDIGDRYDIHPTNKQEVGRRLSLAARVIAYGAPGRAGGPSPRTAEWRADKVSITFDGVDDHLSTRGGSRAMGFELCDAGRSCRFVEGVVEGKRVLLDAPAAPAFVRYLWADSPVVNLYDASGRPALPFEMPVQ